MNNKGFLPLLGGLLAAVAASSCCILPLILGAASAGTLGLGAALAPYRPYLVGLTLLLLAGGFYFTYRPQQSGCKTECDTTQKTARAKRFNKTLLWVVAVFTVGALAYPNLAAYAVSRAESKAPMVAESLPSQEVAFTVGNLTCAECTLSIAKALKNAPGVYEASIDFASKRAVVRYDAKRVGVTKLRSVIEQSGFSVTGSDLAVPG